MSTVLGSLSPLKGVLQHKSFSLSDTFISKSRLVLSIANCEHVTVQASAQTCITIRSAAFFVSRTGKLLETSAVEES